MSGLGGFLSAMLQNADAFPKRPAGLGRSENGVSSILDMPLRNGRTVGMQRMMSDGMQPMQQQPQQPQQQPMMPFDATGGNSLAAYMRGNLPLARLMLGQ